MRESTDIQRLIDESTIANKTSRLQVFELDPAHWGGTVLIGKVQRQWAVKAVCMVVLLAARAAFAVLPA